MTHYKKVITLLLLNATLLTGCTVEVLAPLDTPDTNVIETTDTMDTAQAEMTENTLLTWGEIPSPDDLPLNVDYVELNDNVPTFTTEELEIVEPFHTYAELDTLGRVGVADALLDQSLMPEDERGVINEIYPSGWNQENYTHIDSGGWLYNRSHLIGHQLAGFDGNSNIITGTRQFNVDGMLPIENFVASTIEETDAQVRYRVTPIYADDNLLAHGVVMEGFSTTDNGDTLSFNVFIPNQQAGVALDYATGASTRTNNE